MKKFLSLFTLVFILFAPVAVFAADGDDDSAPVVVPDTDPFGVKEVGDSTGLKGGEEGSDLRVMAGSVIKTALGFLGVIAIVIILIGGFKFMISGGAEEKVAKARKWIMYGVIGLVIVLSAYAITYFVFKEFEEVQTIEES